MNNVLELKLKFADKGFSQAASRKMHSKAVVSDKDIERISSSTQNEYIKLHTYRTEE